MAFGAPSQGQRAGGGNADANSRETARADIDVDHVCPAFIGQLGDHRHKPFGMSATNVFVERRDARIALKQGNRARARRGINNQPSHRNDAVTDQTILLKRSNPGRGLRSKILAGSP